METTTETVTVTVTPSPTPTVVDEDQLLLPFMIFGALLFLLGGIILGAIIGRLTGKKDN